MASGRSRGVRKSNRAARGVLPPVGDDCLAAFARAAWDFGTVPDCNRPGDPVGRHYIGRHSAQRGDPLRLRENAESPQKADAVQRRLEQGWDSSTSLAWSRPGEHFVGRHAVRPATDCPQYVLANKRNQSVGTTRKSGHKSASKRRRHRRDTTQSLSMPAVEQVVAATGSGCGELLGLKTWKPAEQSPRWARQWTTFGSAASCLLELRSPSDTDNDDRWALRVEAEAVGACGQDSRLNVLPIRMEISTADAVEKPLRHVTTNPMRKIPQVDGTEASVCVVRGLRLSGRIICLRWFNSSHGEEDGREGYMASADEFRNTRHCFQSLQLIYERDDQLPGEDKTGSSSSKMKGLRQRLELSDASSDSTEEDDEELQNIVDKTDTLTEDRSDDGFDSDATDDAEIDEKWLSTATSTICSDMYS